MKSFKQWDWIVQTVLILASIFVSLALRRTGDLFLLSYFVVGGWQMISVAVHALNPAIYRSVARKVYLWLLLLTVLSTIIVILISMNSNSDFILGWLVGILFWTPALALFYLVICIWETRRLKEVPPPVEQSAVITP
jgi:glucan phosphoethanolaminetransferase (alkaline phosphatase superfamily)